MGEIWSELRRRNIFRVAAAYVVLGWVLLQVASIVAPALSLPGWAVSFVLFILIIGFPLALFLAWAFELTPDGLRRTVEVDPQHSVAAHTGRKLDFGIIGVLSLGILFLLIDRLFIPPATNSVTQQEVVRSSIAVLPFVNMSSDPEQEYFSDGISEEILNVLAQIPDLHVTSRSSAFQFRGNDIHIPTVASKLGVANILEGSVRKSGTRIKITAQLIEATTDRHLWSDTYERELTDIFAIQEEISQAIVDALHVHLGLEQPTLLQVPETDVEAYRLYLLGRHNFEQRKKETLYKAVGFFEQAIAIDPDYAPSWTGKADAWLLLLESQYGDLSQAESNALAKPLIERALQLDPGLADAHASQGLLLQNLQQFELSRKAFDRAIELNPNLARAWQWRSGLLQISGDLRGALKGWQRSQALDPLSTANFQMLTLGHVVFGQFAEAEELIAKQRATGSDDSGWLGSTESWAQAFQGNWSAQYTIAKATVEKHPSARLSQSFPFSLLSLKIRDLAEIGVTGDVEGLFNDNQMWAAVRLDRHEKVLADLNNLPDLSEGTPGPLFASLFSHGQAAPVLALSRQQGGDEAGTERLMLSMETYVRTLKEQGAIWTLPILEAKVHALRGEDDGVITALEQAHRDGYLTWFELDYVFFDAVRDREDFQALVRAVDAKVNEERAKLGWEPVE